MVPNSCCLSLLILLGVSHVVLGQETDQEFLQGTWVVVSGRLDVPFSEDPVVSIEFSGDSVVARVGNDRHSETYMDYVGGSKFVKKLDESSMPPQVDLWVGG